MPPIIRDLHKKAYIASATTTLVKTGAGGLYRLIIGGTLGAITIYDALTATGTPIALFTPAASGVWDIGLKFDTGLTIVTATAMTIAVSYE